MEQHQADLYETQMKGILKEVLTAWAKEDADKVTSLLVKAEEIPFDEIDELDWEFHRSVKSAWFYLYYLKNSWEKTEYEENNFVYLQNNQNEWFDWTVRIVRWSETDNELEYYLTRPGYQGWFSPGYMKKHDVKYRMEEARNYLTEGVV